MVQISDPNMKYTVARHNRQATGALVDRGANGGIAGDDTRIIERTQQRVDLSGIDNHEMCDIPITSVGAHIRTQNGPVIAVMHNYAVVSGHKTIHSSVQLADNGVRVDDCSPTEGGKLCPTTSEGYKMPLVLAANNKQQTANNHITNHNEIHSFTSPTLNRFALTD